MKRPIVGLACWWRGCEPDYAGATGDAVPCRRCAACDTTYSDRVGDTRRARVRGWLAERLWHRPLAMGARMLCLRQVRMDRDATPF